MNLIPSIEDGDFCFAMNATGGTVVAGTGVILSVVTLHTPNPGDQGTGEDSAFEFTLPLGSTTTSGSLGVTLEDIPSGATSKLKMTGFIACRSDGSGSALQALTLDALGRMKHATVSGCEVLAIAYTTPNAGTVWARLVVPYLLP